MSLLTLSPIALVCLISLGIVALLLLVYYFGLFGPFVFRKEKSRTSNEDLPPISIVITAHNEAHHLVESLPVILTQEYPDYEVVLVNDNSQDEIEQLALELNNRYHHLHYVNMGSSRSTMEGRKFPFAIGIQAASNPTVVFTNSSCIPPAPSGCNTSPASSSVRKRWCWPIRPTSRAAACSTSGCTTTRW